MTLTPEFCQNLAEFAFRLGRLFIWVALLAAVAHVIVQSIVALRGGETKAPAQLTGIDKVLEALKGVLEALAKLPHWVAIFLAGLALLWMAGQRPEACKAPEPAPPAGNPAPPAPPGNTG